MDYYGRVFGQGNKVIRNFCEYLNGKFQVGIYIAPLDGKEVKPYKGDYVYRLVCIGINEFNDYQVQKRPANIEALKEELKSLSYEEVCKRFNLAE